MVADANLSDNSYRRPSPHLLCGEAMRQTKFRAFNIRQKRMYWNVQNAYDMQSCHDHPEHSEYRDNPIECERDFLPSSFGSVLENEDYILMQFTGLTDRNGKEIYEGDVVRHYYQDTSELLFIEWEKQRAGFILSGDEIMYEVIGNIYSNPELLEKP